MHILTDDEAGRFAAIYARLAALGAYSGALPWHDGERHTDDRTEDTGLRTEEGQSRTANIPHDGLSVLSPHLSVLGEIYACAYCAGAGLPCDVPHTDGMAALLVVLAERHRVEVLRPRGWDDPPILADELPGWLLRQKRYGVTSDK